MTINRSKSNKIKRNKTKRRIQTKNKRRRQTKNKRRRQHGGTTYQYTPGSKDILKEGILPNPVLIPGYSEIVDMMKEYEDPLGSDGRFIIQSNKIKEDIKKKEVHLLTDCSLQTQIDERKIIVLRKQDKTKLVFIKLDNNAIECTPEQYYAFASHNFRIFIRDILQWNPFLNLPEHKKRKEQQGWQGYGNPHTYSSTKIFKDNDDDWWNNQEWWTQYKGTDEFITAVAEAAAAAEEARRAVAEAAEEARRAATAQQQQPVRTQQIIEQQRAELRLLKVQIQKINIGLKSLKETVTNLKQTEEITEDVKNILNTKIDTLLSPTSHVPSS
jgi:hypothetical protein